PFAGSGEGKMRTVVGEGRFERTLSIRAPRLFCSRSRFRTRAAGFQSHDHVERYVGQNGGTDGGAPLNFWDDTGAPLQLEGCERAIQAREHLLFSEDFQEMVEARPGVAAGDREPRRMNQHGRFYAETRSSCF